MWRRLLLSCFFALCALAWAGAQAPTSGKGSLSSFDAILQKLEQELLTLRGDMASLTESLQRSETRLLELERQLKESQDLSSELSSSLELSEQRLKTSESSLASALSISGRQGIELWVWRGATAILAILLLIR